MTKHIGTMLLAATLLVNAGSEPDYSWLSKRHKPRIGKRKKVKAARAQRRKQK